MSSRCSYLSGAVASHTESAARPLPIRNQNHSRPSRNAADIIPQVVVRFASVAAKFGKIGVSDAGSAIALRAAAESGRIGLIEALPCPS